MRIPFLQCHHYFVMGVTPGVGVGEDSRAEADAAQPRGSASVLHSAVALPSIRACDFVELQVTRNYNVDVAADPGAGQAGHRLCSTYPLPGHKTKPPRPVRCRAPSSLPQPVGGQY